MKYALTVTLGDVVDELHDENCFANAGTTEKANFTPFLIRREQVNNLLVKLSRHSCHKKKYIP